MIVTTVNEQKNGTAIQRVGNHIVGTNLCSLAWAPFRKHVTIDGHASTFFDRRSVTVDCDCIGCQSRKRFNDIALKWTHSISIPLQLPKPLYSRSSSCSVFSKTR